MRICCNDSGINIAGDINDSESKLKQLRDLGIRVFGIGGAEKATEDDIKRFNDLTAKYDMYVGMSPTGWQPAHPDVSKRKDQQENLKTTLRNVGKVGGDVIHICGGSYDGSGWWYHPKNFTQQGLDDLVTEVKKVAPYAEDAGVCIAPETTQWCILNSPERMREFVDRVDSPYVKVTLDFCNHMRPDRIADPARFFKCTLALLGDRIGMLHIKDVDVVSGLSVHINEVHMGTGLIDHAPIIRESDDLEPWKPFSMEHFNRKDISQYQQIEETFKHLQGVADRIGHKWSDPGLTRKRFLAGK